MDFKALVDPATTLGAFLISMGASIVVSIFIGFFSGKTYQIRKINKNIQNNGIVQGDANVGCTIIGDKKNE